MNRPINSKEKQKIQYHLQPGEIAKKSDLQIVIDDKDKSVEFNQKDKGKSTFKENSKSSV